MKKIAVVLLTIFYYQLSLSGFCQGLLANKKRKDNMAYNHLSEEIQAYYNFWKSLLNRKNKKVEVVYAGLGADISTPLLALNATEIKAIDIHQYNFKKLKISLAHWKSLELHDRNLPRINKKI